MVHTALTLLPGDSVRALFGPTRPDPAAYAKAAEMYHFDDPWYLQYLQYLLYLRDLVMGNWGETLPSVARHQITQGPPVAHVLRGSIRRVTVLGGDAGDRDGVRVADAVGLAAAAVPAVRDQPWLAQLHVAGPRASSAATA